MKNILTEFLEMKTRMSVVRNKRGRTDGRLDITGEKVDESEDIGIETILTET